MQGVFDLLDSERGVFCVLLVLCCTVFVVVGKMTVDQWITYTQSIGAVLVASKTVTGVAETLSKKAAATPAPAAPAAPAPAPAT